MFSLKYFDVRGPCVCHTCTHEKGRKIKGFKNEIKQKKATSEPSLITCGLAMNCCRDMIDHQMEIYGVFNWGSLYIKLYHFFFNQYYIHEPLIAKSFCYLVIKFWLHLGRKTVLWVKWRNESS